ncbi:hypothetical protein LTR56_003307 [Elasticomyces elasticus]|nr:hypothetical protein LTR56_003307 [Elasticomyces elasticus]KAK4931491.1 hypothetical protein LTR49_002192 [Elasticomyces elasticus]KAK5765990.1 hypothetical protein LTS12_003736 [Elasticomyces elasticus]
MAATSLAPARLDFYDETYAARPTPTSFGAKMKVRTNFFQLQTGNLPRHIYVYSFSFPQINTRDVVNKNVKKELIRLVLLDQFFQSNGIRQDCFTEWNGMLVSLRELEVQPGANFSASTSRTFTVTWHNQSQPTIPVLLPVQIQRIHMLDKYDLKDYCEGTNFHDCSTLLSVLNVLARARATGQAPPITVKVGREKFFPLVQNPNHRWTSCGLEARTGHLSSVRAFKGGLAMNVHGVATAFITPQPLLQYLVAYEPAFRPRHPQTTLTSGNARNLDGDFKALAGQLQVRYMYAPPDPANPQPAALLPGGNGRLKRVNGFGLSARLQMFTHSTHGVISVENYFNRHVLPQNSRIQHPHLLVVDTGSATSQVWVPPELLWIEPHQPKRGMLRDTEMARMLSVAQRGPAANIINIESTLAPNGIFDTAFLAGAPRLMVTPTMKEVQASMLPCPSLVYAGGRQPQANSLSNGRWNIIGTQFAKAGHLNTLGVIDYGTGSAGSITGFQGLASALTTYGITSSGNRPMVREPAAGRPASTSLQTAYDNLQSKTGSLPVVLVVLPAAQGGQAVDDYATVKTWADTQAGVNTVCITSAKVLSLSDKGFLANIALKFNVKLGGENHRLNSNTYTPGTMIVGADVTHPSGGSVTHCPSIAAVVASCNAAGVTYPGSLRLQKSKQEMIGALDDMISERLIYWHRKNGKLPTDILFYRDGVSESQFAMVKRYELPGVLRGCDSAAAHCNVPDYKPRITIVVCDKRHHTRFFAPQNVAPNQRVHLDSHVNFKPGLLVEDDSIRSPYHFDFYLQSHRALQGTARPCHYFVIENGMNLSPMQLQRITFSLCWTFATALTPISYCAPAYYADRLAERGRCYLRPLLTLRYPGRPSDAQLLAGMANSAMATEDEKDEYVSGLIASGVGPWNTFWPALAAGRTNPQMLAIADTMFYI